MLKIMHTETQHNFKDLLSEVPASGQYDTYTNSLRKIHVKVDFYKHIPC